jgi:redox-sensitive bicupin YhaK (pirin superfamily)
MVVQSTMSNLEQRPLEQECSATTSPAPELLEPREVPLGGPRAMTVRRTLPHKRIRTIGAWCFVDDYGPAHTAMSVPPHPHIGLQTVSWLLAGEVEHRDSLGSLQVVRPGELNLMTAGHGIAHSEYSVGDGPLRGVQLWVALPEGARDGAPAFAHHSDLPAADGVQVFIGEVAGARSPARVHSPLVGAQTSGQVHLPLDPDFEYAVLALEPLSVNGSPVPQGALQYLGWGLSEVRISGQALLLGGEPMTEHLLMWWNFVGRSHDEIVVAREHWQAGDPRFGDVPGDDHPRLPAPAMPGVQLKPRPPR